MSDITDKQFSQVILAAFLHTIGKVSYRADHPATEESNQILQRFSISESHPKHLLWTIDFLDKYKSTFNLEQNDQIDEDFLQLVLDYYNPSTPLQQIFHEAEILSAGTSEVVSRQESGDHKTQRMASLLSLMTFDKMPQSDISKVPFTPLTSVDDSIYPNSCNEEVDLTSVYRSLWEKFSKQWDQSPYHSFESNLAYLSALCERFFWCIPSNLSAAIPDTSLYEHSKATAALAGVLYQYHTQTHSFTMNDIVDRKSQKFLMLVGDLSGIQKFIFQISHLGGGKVAKRLRARSFLLEMIIQTISRKFLVRLGLPFLNIIMNAGGKFYLLLPNTEECHNTINELSSESQSWLHENFYGDISLNLAYITLSGDDFTNRRIGQKFVDLADQLLVKKYSPLKNYLTDDNGWSEDKFIVSKALITTEKSTGVYENPLPSNIDDEKLGTALSRYKCLAIYPDLRGDYHILDWSFSLRSSAKEYEDGAHCLLSFKRGTEDAYSDKSVPVHYEYKGLHVPIYKPNVFPAIDEYRQKHPEEGLDPGQVLPFSAIAHVSPGPSYIGYLKADIDNLGYVLANGLQWNDIGWTLSKKATFSRLLELFFSGRIRNLLDDPKKQNPSYNLIYTVFSGGDDLFLVGPWDVMHRFADHLNKEWKQYCGQNPNLTLSLGITVNRPLSPLWSAAEQSEEALSNAKNNSLFEHSSPKNQLCSFNHLIKWDELEAIQKDIKQIDQWIKELKLPTAFVRTLLYYSFLASLYWKDRKVEGLRYLPLLSYNVSRNLKERKYEPVRQWVEKLKNPDSKMIRHLDYIAHYSLLINRSS